MVKKQTIGNFSKGQFDLFEPSRIPEGGAELIKNMFVKQDGSVESMKSGDDIADLGSNQVLFFTSWVPKYKYYLDSTFSDKGYYYVVFYESSIKLYYYNSISWTAGQFVIPDNITLGSQSEYYIYKSPERIIVADGTNKGFSLSINKYGEITTSSIGLKAPTKKLEVSGKEEDKKYIETDTLSSTGMTVERGSLLRLAYTYTIKGGGESNPSPVTIYNDDPQHYPDSEYSVGYKWYLTSCVYKGMDLPDIGENELSSLRVYRSTKIYKDDSLTFTVLELAVEKNIDSASSISDIEVSDSKQLQGEIITYENDLAPILYDVAQSGGRVFGVARDPDPYTKFPITYEIVYKLTIANPNSETNAEAIVPYVLDMDDIPSIDSGDLINKPDTVRIIDKDLTTPIPVVYKKYIETGETVELTTDSTFSAGLANYTSTGYYSDGSVVYSEILTTGNTVEIKQSTSLENLEGDDIKFRFRGEITYGGVVTFTVKDRGENVVATFPDIAGNFEISGIDPGSIPDNNYKLVAKNTGSVDCQIKPLEEFYIASTNIIIDALLLYMKLPELIGNQSRDLYLCYNSNEEQPEHWVGDINHGNWVDYDTISDYKQQAVFDYHKPFYSKERNKIVSDMKFVEDGDKAFPNFCDGGSDAGFTPTVPVDIVAIDSAEQNTILLPNTSELIHNDSLNAYKLNNGYANFGDIAGNVMPLYTEDFGSRDEGTWAFFISIEIDLNELTPYLPDDDTPLQCVLSSCNSGSLYYETGAAGNTDGWVLYFKREVGKSVELRLVITDDNDNDTYDDIILASFADPTSKDVRVLDILVSFDFSTNGDETGIINSFVYDNKKKDLITREDVSVDYIGITQELTIGVKNNIYIPSDSGAPPAYGHQMINFYWECSQFLWFSNIVFKKIEQFIAIKNFQNPYLTTSVGFSLAQYNASENVTVNGGVIQFNSPISTELDEVSVGDFIVLGSTYDQDTSALGTGFYRIKDVNVAGGEITVSDNVDNVIGVKRDVTILKANSNIEIEELEGLSDYQVSQNRLIWSNEYGTAFPDLNFKQVDSPIKRIMEAPSFLKLKYENTVLVFTDNDIYRFVLTNDSGNWRLATDVLIRDKVANGLYAKRSLCYGDGIILYLSKQGIIAWDETGMYNITKDKNDITISEDMVIGFDSNNNRFYISDDGNDKIWVYQKELKAITEANLAISSPIFNSNQITGDCEYVDHNKEVYIREVVAFNKGTSLISNQEIKTKEYDYNSKVRARRINVNGTEYGTPTYAITQQRDSTETIQNDTSFTPNKNQAIPNVWGDAMSIDIKNMSDIKKIVLEIIGGE